jgi:hypothetical protein
MKYNLQILLIICSTAPSPDSQNYGKLPKIPFENVGTYTGIA